MASGVKCFGNRKLTRNDYSQALEVVINHPGPRNIMEDVIKEAADKIVDECTYMTDEELGELLGSYDLRVAVLENGYVNVRLIELIYEIVRVQYHEWWSTRRCLQLIVQHQLCPEWVKTDYFARVGELKRL